MRIIQVILIHDVISRPKIVLDQITEGLSVLGFHDKMKEFPEMFEQLFIPIEHKLSPCSVLDVLEFPGDMSEGEATIESYLKQFLSTAKPQMLEKFLLFATGSTCLPNFGFGKIQVKFDITPSIFASTCLLSVTFPNYFPDMESFNAALKAVIDSTTTKAFNCV